MNCLWFHWRPNPSNCVLEPILLGPVMVIALIFCPSFGDVSNFSFTKPISLMLKRKTLHFTSATTPFLFPPSLSGNSLQRVVSAHELQIFFSHFLSNSLPSGFFPKSLHQNDSCPCQQYLLNVESNDHFSILTVFDPVVTFDTADHLFWRKIFFSLGFQNVTLPWFSS